MHGQTVPCPETGDVDLMFGLSLSLDDYVCPCSNGCPLCDPDGRNK